MNETQQRIPEQEWVLTVVEAPRHFVKVGRKVLCRDFMPRSHDAALEQAEGRLNRIRMEVSDHILFRAMVYDAMFISRNCCLSQGRRIGHEIIAHDHVNVGRDVLADVLRQRPRLCVLSVEEPERPTPLTDADHYLFRVLPGPDALADLLSANVGFVHFAGAIQLWFTRLFDRVTDAMTQVPRRAIVNLEHPVKLVRRHALLRLADQIHSKEPFREGEMGIVKHGACRHRELVTASLGIAVVLIALQDRGHFLAAALRAADALGPAEMLKIVAAMLIVAVSFYQFAKINGFFHRSTHA